MKSQGFLLVVMEGDKRIFFVDGEPMGAANHKPKEGEFRSNLAVDGHSEATEFRDRVRLIYDTLAPALMSQGLFFVGSNRPEKSFNIVLDFSSLINFIDGWIGE